MPLLRKSAKQIDESAVELALAQQIAEQFRFQNGYMPSEAERRSWERSLPVLASDLIDAGLANLEILVEFDLPFTSKRVDAVVAGFHAKTGIPTYLFVELKQWSEAHSFDGDDTLVVVPTYGKNPVLHPQVQVHDYLEYAKSYLRVLQDDDVFSSSVAYLHNATQRSVQSLLSAQIHDAAQTFTGEDRGRFINYLKTIFAPLPGAEVGDLLIGSAIGSSTQLMAVAAEEIQAREVFTLLDEQRIAFASVWHQVQSAQSADNKQVVVITGGPGSGKSAIALQLLGDLNRRGYTSLHVTGSKSFTETLRKVAGSGSSRTKNLFQYFRNMAKAQKNSIDVLIADEAHRVRETSTNRFSKPIDRTGRAQLDELIDCARVPVFLLDEHQTVRPDEVGSVEAIKKVAEQKGLNLVEISLTAQFRCGGSKKYEEWVESFLGLNKRLPIQWTGDNRFSLITCDSPEDLEAWTLAKHSTGDTARMAAGFCWKWSEPTEEGNLVNDVVIGAWAKPWNAKSDRALADAPASVFWATDPKGVGQVGCIYTAQGFEYDWNGVILGPDIVYRNGVIETDRLKSKDSALKSSKLNEAEADALIRNAYKVLLTRSMKGTAVFAVDLGLQEFLTSLIGPTN